ncbi:MAG: DUF11 domain-containing protein [Caldilineaceae bacterium]|nr:DUF11 domain-containing protein [Caldilineaceae bacterium]
MRSCRPDREETFTYTIDWGDGGPISTGPITNVVNGGIGTPTTGALGASHTYITNNIYTVTVTIFDDDGGAASNSLLVTVFNDVPTVFITGPTTVNESTTITRTFTFTVEDKGVAGDTFSIAGGPLCGSGTSPTVLHFDTDDGSGAFTCIFPDGPSNTSVSIFIGDGTDIEVGSLALTVNNVPPTVTAASNQTSIEGLTKSFNLGSFTDPGEDSPWTIHVNWGDGNTTSFTQTVSGTISTGDHTYADNGIYTVTVTVEDDADSASNSFTVTVNNVAPTIVNIVGAQTVNEGQTFTLTRMITFTDPGFNTETFTYTVNWGDGSTPITEPVTSLLNGGVGVLTRGSITESYTYADNGVYTVTVTVVDDDSGSASNSFTVTVNNVAPTIVNIVGAQTVNEGQTFTLTRMITFTDPGFNTESFTYTVNWDDGNVSSGSVVNVINGGVGVSTTGSLTVSHTYTDNRPTGVNGPYTVTVTIGDGDAIVTGTIPITVVNVAPTATFTNSGPVTEGMTVTVGFSAQFDPSTADTAAGFRYAYSCTNANLAGTGYNDVGTTPSATATCNFGDDGSYNVRGAIIDKDGALTQYTTTVTVNNGPPTITNIVVGHTVNEGQTFTLTHVITFADPGFPSETFTYTVNWGDSSTPITNPVTSVITGSAGVSTTGSLTVSHTYNGRITYTVTVIIRDKDGGEVTGTIPITVTNVPPIAVDDIAFTDENTPIDIPVLANDTDFADDLPFLVVHAVGAPITGTAVITASNKQIHFDPTNFTYLPDGVIATDTFTYTISDTVDVSNVATVTVTITGVNDAPVLLITRTLTLTTITEDETSNIGDAVADIILDADSQTAIFDPDDPSLDGIAIVDLDAGNGYWEYTLNDVDWFDVAPVSVSSALLLTPTHRMRFVPNGIDGTTATITFRAWDQTSGAAGNKVNTSANGGTTAFSALTIPATITVVSINDAPELTIDGPFEAFDELNLDLGGRVLITDVDAGTGIISVTLQVSSGILAVTTTVDLPASQIVGNNTANVEITGTLNAITTALGTANGLIYRNLPTVVGTETLTVTVNDRGNTGDIGGAQEVTATSTITVVGIPDLQISKSDGVSEEAPGEVLTYTIAYTNAGTALSTGVLITETVPANTKYISTTETSAWSCAENSGAGTLCVFTASDLAVNDSGIVTFTVQITDTTANNTTITNTVLIGGSPGEDKNPGNNSAQDGTTVLKPTFDITKRDTGVTVAPGQRITYTINYTNTSGVNANNVVITETVPQHTTFVLAASSSGWSCPDGAVAGTLCTLTHGKLNKTGAGSNDSKTFVVVVNSTLPSGVTQITNTATISAPTGIAKTSNVVTTTLSLPNLTVRKTASPSPVIAGTAITYTVVVSNAAGAATATNVTISDTLPLTVTLVQSSTTGSLTCTSDTPIRCSVPTLSAGSAVTLTITGTLAANAPVGQVITNTAAVTYTQVITTLSASAPITVSRSATLTITKSVTSTAVVAGERITYTVVVTNNGPSNAANVTISDTVPVSVTQPVTTVAGLAGCSGTTTLRCSVLDLAPQTPVTLTISGIVSSTLANNATFTNTAAVTSTQSMVPVTATVRVTSTRQVTFDIVKRAITDTVEAGKQISYTIVVTNTGPSQASAVTISDTLPLSVTSPISSTSGVATCSGTTLLRCTVGTLNVGSAVTWTITGTVNVNAPSGLVITNTASVTSTERLTATVSNAITSTVTRDVSFAITKTVSSGVVNAGGTITYAVTISNTGSITATNVVLTDTLPVSITNVTSSTQGLAGAVCSGTTTITCSAPSLSAGAVATLTITGTVDAALPAGIITNTAGVTSQEVTTPQLATVGKSISNSADLRVSIAVTPTSGLLYGQTLTYTVNITNGGPSAAQNTLVTVTLPISVAFEGVVTPPVGFTGPTANGQQRIWSATPFGVTSTDLVFTGTITGTGVISTSVVITSSSTDIAPGNNSASTANLTVANQPPILDLVDLQTSSYMTSTGRMAIAPSALVTDVDTPIFNGGILTVTIQSGGAANDALEIDPQGQVSLSGGNTVNHNSTAVGTYVFGTGATAQLTVTFNSNASVAIVRDIVQTIAFTNSAPGVVDRVVSFTLSDGQGGVSDVETITVVVGGVGDHHSLLLTDEEWPSAGEEQPSAPLQLFLPLVGAQQEIHSAADPPVTAPDPALIPADAEIEEAGEPPPSPEQEDEPEAAPFDGIRIYLPTVQRE